MAPASRRYRAVRPSRNCCFAITTRQFEQREGFGGGRGSETRPSGRIAAEPSDFGMLSPHSSLVSDARSKSRCLAGSCCSITWPRRATSGAGLRGQRTRAQHRAGVQHVQRIAERGTPSRLASSAPRRARFAEGGVTSHRDIFAYALLKRRLNLLVVNRAPSQCLFCAELQGLIDWIQCKGRCKIFIQ